MRCRWVKDKGVPGGRYLVPGCWQRAIYGDDADCTCETVGRKARCPCCGQVLP